MLKMSSFSAVEPEIRKMSCARVHMTRLHYNILRQQAECRCSQSPASVRLKPAIYAGVRDNVAAISPRNMGAHKRGDGTRRMREVRDGCSAASPACALKSAVRTSILENACSHFSRRPPQPRQMMVRRCSRKAEGQVRPEPAVPHPKKLRHSNQEATRYAHKACHSRQKFVIQVGIV